MMEFIQDAAIVVLIIGSIIALTITDKRFNLGLISMESTENWSTDFGTSAQSNAEKDKEIAELKQRIEVLEKLATDPALQLDREISKL